MKTTLIMTIMLISSVQLFGQHLGITFQEAEKQGIHIKSLDSIYKSAVHTDTSMAVFKTKQEQQTMGENYVKLLQEFGKFLKDHDFKWNKPTKCFNRIYFNQDGTIDYFLFNFLGKPEDKPSGETQEEFKRLLNLFIKDYRFPLKAKCKFAQCSPTTYT